MTDGYNDTAATPGAFTALQSATESWVAWETGIYDASIHPPRDYFQAGFLAAVKKYGESLRLTLQYVDHLQTRIKELEGPTE